MATNAIAFAASHSDSVCIREVWADNLQEEFKLMKGIVKHFPYVGMDTEFPGFLHKPQRQTVFGGTSSDSTYAALKANVDTLNLIQVGFTFCDENGNLPQVFCCEDRKSRKSVWQFNFKEFDLDDENSKYSHESIQLLKKSGIDFQKNKEKGIDCRIFAAKLMSSGIVRNPKVQWITFQGAYDFGYLLKILTSQKLPSKQEGFFNMLRLYFPSVYDVKYLSRFCSDLHGGLATVASQLKVERIAGTAHQAGSDSLLTSWAFIKLKGDYFNGNPCRRMLVEAHAGRLYTLGY